MAVRLYLTLRRHGDASGLAFPGRKRLAELCSAGIKTVDRAKDELVEAGAICYRRRHSDDGDWTSNLYHVHWERSLACTFFDATLGQNRPHPRVKNDPTPSVKNDTLTNTQVEPRPKEVDRFPDFWQVYPKRVGRKAAATKWRTAVKNATPDDIIEGAKRYRDDPKRDPEFTANPATWLNHERWLDEYETPKQTGPVTVMDLYADEPCPHGDPLGEAKCPLCRRQ